MLRFEPELFDKRPAQVLSRPHPLAAYVVAVAAVGYAVCPTADAVARLEQRHAQPPVAVAALQQRACCVQAAEAAPEYHHVVDRFVHDVVVNGWWDMELTRVIDTFKTEKWLSRSYCTVKMDAFEDVLLKIQSIGRQRAKSSPLT